MTTVAVAAGVFSFILAAALGIFMCVKRRRRDTQTVEKDTPRETQRACRDPHSDTYASLDVKSISPEYDTLTGVKRAAKHTELHTSAEPEGTYSCLDFCQEGRRAGGQMNRKKL
ncbi:B-cell receptor CD22-like isoform X2 [Arapaima gigas]